MLSLTSPALLPAQAEIRSVQAQTTQDSKQEAADQLLQTGIEQFKRGQLQEALESYQQALTQYRELGDRAQEAITLENIARVYEKLGQDERVLEYYQQAVAIHQELDNPTAEGNVLRKIGYVYRLQGEHEKALAIRQEIGDRSGESATLSNLGVVYTYRGEYSKALENYEQSLAISQEIGNRSGVATTLSNIGLIYDNRGEYSKAIKNYEQSLAIRQEIGDRAGVATILSNIGGVYDNRGEYSKALENYEQSLAIRQEIGARSGEGVSLNNIGGVYTSRGEYEKAINVYEQSLTISQEIGDRSGVGNTLSNLGIVYYNRAEYPKAIDYYEQAIAIQQEIGNRAGEVTTLNNMGFVHMSLGQYNQALDFFEQSRAIAQDIGSRPLQAIAYNAIGGVYFKLEEYQQSLNFHQKALAIHQEIEGRPMIAVSLNQIGGVYNKLEEYEKALNYHQKSLGIARDIGDKLSISLALNHLGETYTNQQNYPQAFAVLQQAIVLHQELGTRRWEREALHNLGILQQAQNQPELAIVFLKQAVNLSEAIRQDLKVLPVEQQRTYTETVVDTYRTLADLLLQQDRVLEAQEVIDLLKLQELEDYLRDVRGNEQTAQGLDFWEAERKILQLYQQWTQQTPLPPFETFVNSPEVTALVGQLQRTARGQNLNPEQLARLQDNLQSLDNAALLYPLILDDRIELVLVTPTSLIRETVFVDRVKLNEAIAHFRSNIEKPSRDPIPNAQQLYQWLIQPIEAELETAQVNTILYAADSQLRYIPLAALHDGKQYLIQRFTLNHITAASLTNFNGSRQRPMQILAAAYSNPQLPHKFEIDGKSYDFRGLKFAGIEVETIAKDIPDTTAFFNQEFSRDNLEPRMDEHSIVHLATHADFVSGSPHESFILFGSGERVTLADIDEWQLSDVDMVVLSACRTAASSTAASGELGNGEEILGFGYQIQRTGAEAAVASLWQVSDGGTQALMNAFYAALQGDNITKAEALRQAQIALITGNYEALGEQRGSLIVEFIGDNLPSQVSNNLNHPYYWAPFILIGNGL